MDVSTPREFQEKNDKNPHLGQYMTYDIARISWVVNISNHRDKS